MNVRTERPIAGTVPAWDVGRRFWSAYPSTRVIVECLVRPEPLPAPDINLSYVRGVLYRPGPNEERYGLLGLLRLQWACDQIEDCNALGFVSIEPAIDESYPTLMVLQVIYDPHASRIAAAASGRIILAKTAADRFLTELTLRLERQSHEMENAS